MPKQLRCGAVMSMNIKERLQELREKIQKLRQQKSITQKLQLFKFKPFSRKQKQVLTWWMPDSPVREMEGIIADGAIRSGKTVSMSLSFVLWAMHGFTNQSFGMCGKTIGSFRRNVVFWLKIMLRTRGYKVTDHRADNILTVSKGGITNRFYIFGGKDERSQDLVQGVTLAGVFFDEVALMPESFVNQATGRCSVDGSKFWFNCNPAGPMHWFKVKWINKISERNLLYLHFTMDDNLSLSEKIKERYRNSYAGVFYLRYIEGLWAVAEGLIYTMFTEANIYNDDTRPKGLEYLSRRTIALDYGTTNPCVFLDIYDDGTTIRVDREYRWDSRAEKAGPKTDSQYGDDMVEFMGDNPEFMCDIVADPSATSYITELRNRGYVVEPADNEVLDGIREVATMFQTGRLMIHERCTGLITELRSYVWDEKAGERGEEKPVKQLDHGPDALRYYIKTKLPAWRKCA